MSSAFNNDSPMGSGKFNGARSAGISVGPNQIPPGTYKILNLKDGVALDYLASAADKSNAVVSYSHLTEQQKVSPLLRSAVVDSMYA